MVRPLRLPPGSVRALLLLGLTARAVLELRRASDLEPWLVAAVAMAAASYFAARSAGMGNRAPAHRHPLYLPAGTVRLLFLVAAAYGAWLWFHTHGTSIGALPVIWIFIAYALGLIVRWVNRRRLYSLEAAATYFEHLSAVVSLLAVAALVWRGVTPADSTGWVDPLLAAIGVHYFATR